MCKSLLRKSLVLAFAMIATLTASAQKVEISDEAGLRAIADNLQGSYVLTADITLTSEWSPIGSDAGNNDPSSSFQGEFDGAGHTINGLKVGGGSDIGFFGHTWNAYIHDVKFINANVGAYGNGNRAGIVVGNAHNTEIDKVFTAGVVNGSDHVGSIAGDTHDNSVVTNCLSTVAVWSSGYQAGGIVGDNDSGTIENNLFLGQAYAGNSWNGCGGIAGINEGNLTASNNFAAPIALGVASGLNAGHMHAIIGWSTTADHFLTNNYSADDIRFYEGSTTVTGEDLDNLNQSEYQGTVVSRSELMATASSVLPASAWDAAAGRFPVLKGMAVPFYGDYIEYTEVPEEFYVGSVQDLQVQSSLDRDVTITSSNPAVVKVEGTKIEGVAAGDAVITLSTVGDAFILGAQQTINVKVSTRDQINITSVEDLEKVRTNPNGIFTLTTDLDLAGVEFTPLPNFQGIFDGAGHVVRNVTVNTPNTSKVGFFAQITGGTIKNLGIEDSYFNGDADVAAVVGWCSGGFVQNCFVSNTYVEGRDHVASITGNMQRQGADGVVISNCLSNARIKTRTYQAGGIAGVANGGTMENCLFSGTIDESSGTNVGALCSLLDNNDWQTYMTTFRNNFAGPAHMFGAAGYGTDGNGRLIHLAGRGANFDNNYIVDNCLYGANISNASAGTELGNANDWNGELVDIATARTRDFYVNTLGWDFDNTWKFLEGAEGKMYPVLKFMNAPLKTLIYNMPDDPTDVYKDEFSGMTISGVVGSWGESTTLEIDAAKSTGSYDYDPDEGIIYYSEMGGAFVAGDIVVNVKVDPALNGIVTVTGANSFTISTVQSGESITISTAEEFLKIGKNPSGNFKLAADIDLTGTDFKGFSGTLPFSGVLDGDGHTVSGINIEETSGTNYGVFANTSGATIKNIAFDNFIVNNPNGYHVGFVGSAVNTKFEKVAFVGTVYGNDHVSVVCGDADNVTVENCYVNGYVYAYSQIGGFFGCTLDNGSTVKNSYFYGDLTAYTRGWVGGFLGLIDKGGEKSVVTIENCVSLGNCFSGGEGSPHVTHPFIGGNRHQNFDSDSEYAQIFFHNNLFNAAATMDAETDWPVNRETRDGGDVVPAEGLPESNFQQQNTYTSIDWDFNNVWTLGIGEYPYPVLKGQNIEPILGIEQVNNDMRNRFNSTKTYNIMGQQVDGTYTKGIIIRDGKKYVVK